MITFQLAIWSVALVISMVICAVDDDKVIQGGAAIAAALSALAILAIGLWAHVP